MQVKGIAVRSTPLFVRQRFANRLQAWLDALPPASRVMMEQRIATGGWYPLAEAFVVPTRAVCDLFFDGRPDGARQIGRFSADYALWGLLRLFVRIGSPHFLIRRAGQVFAAYYRPSQIEVTETGPTSAIVRITRFPQPEELVELRIGGWMERALEISGCSGVQLVIRKSLTRGDPSTEFEAVWR